MLNRVYIDNFRSFVNFEYRPASKQLLLGPNGSGKSSLLEAIRYVQAFLNGEENPFTQSTRTRWQDRPLQVVEIEALLDGKRYDYRIEIAKGKQPSVNVERLKVDGSPVFELADGEVRFFPNAGREATAVPFETIKSALRLAQLSNANVNRFVVWMEESLHCFSIDGYPGTMDETTDREERVPDYELDNLSGWYRHLLQAYPVENALFLNSVREAVEGLISLRFSPDENGAKKLRMDFLAPTNKQVTYSVAELSPGQRYLLGLYMILHFVISKGHTVFIDEPDNFISIREIQPWLLAAETAVEDGGGQLILISHHPETLNQWASDYGLQFYREENGHVRTEKFRADGPLLPSELIARGWEAVGNEG